MEERKMNCEDKMKDFDVVGRKARAQAWTSRLFPGSAAQVEPRISASIGSRVGTVYIGLRIGRRSDLGRDLCISLEPAHPVLYSR